MADGRIVNPLTRRQIEQIAADARDALELSPNGRVAMLPLLEDVLYEVIEGYEFHVREDKEMGHYDGLTDDNRPSIYLANRIYRDLERGDGRARMTAAHEFGHLLLHSGMPVFRPLSDVYDPLYDPERQANVFAAAFLMPETSFRLCRTEVQAMRKFGVSRDAVACRARILKHKFEADRKILSARTKKKGRSLHHTP